MNICRLAISILAGLLFAGTVSNAQDNQFRLLLHPTVDINNHWFAPVWAITTFKTESPPSASLLSGLGYRRGDWWLEALGQSFWSNGRQQWFLNFRYRMDLSSVVIYLEPTVFLNNSTFGESAFVEYRTARGINLGVETENLHKPGRDTLGAGPRMSYQLCSWGNLKFVSAVTYQIRKQERDILRFYVVLNRRF